MFFAVGYGWGGGHLTAPLPGGVTAVQDYDNYNIISDSNHPIVTDELTEGIPLTNADLWGNYCSHVSFDNLSSQVASGSIKNLDIILKAKGSVQNDRTLLPIRVLIESLGGTVEWDNTQRKVTITLGYNTIELFIGKPIAKVNGVNTPIDSTNSKVVPQIINGRTYLPLRFISENLGASVDWDSTTQTITIYYFR